MSKRLILHAGMHKTGSSSIQAFLQSAELDNATYFRWDKSNHSILFVTLFAEHPEAHWYFRQRRVPLAQISAERARLKRDLQRQIEAAPHDLFLFSAERIYGASRADLRACRAFFAPFFDPVSVCCYLREPLSFAASMLQQSLKTGAVPGPRALMPRFRQRIGNLDRVFGSDNVQTRLYADPRRAEQDVVADFCRWTGVRSGGAQRVEVNKSLSVDATALLYLFRRYARYELSSGAAVAASRKMVRALASVPGGRLALGPGMFGAAAGDIEADRVWMEERMGDRFQLSPPGRGGDTITFDSFEALDAYGREVFHRRSGGPFREADWAGSDVGTPERFTAAVV